MWERAELKANAKMALSRYYWMAVLVCLVYGLIAGAGGGGGSALQMVTNLRRNSSHLSYEIQRILPILTTVAVVGSIVALALAFLVINPMRVGLYRYFMESRQFRSDFGTLFSGFTGGNYWHNVKVMGWMDLKVLFWCMILYLPGVIVLVVLMVNFPTMLYSGAWVFLTLLCILLMIPGFIKTYEYYMIPYLLAENPHMDTKRMFELSRQMTNGEKMNIFVLGLSFLGWTLLAVLTCGIGGVFLQPYILATDAELYALMRAKALSLGYSNEGELMGFHPHL